MADGRLPARRRMRGRVPGRGALAASSSSSSARAGASQKSAPEGCPRHRGTGRRGGTGCGPRRGPRRTGGGGLGGGVPRVRVVVPPRVSPLRPPGSSPWWLHQEPVPALVVGGDVDVFSARLLGGEAPSVDVVGAFLLLVRVRPFLLQLLPFVFRPPVLEPHFHLGESEERTGARWGPGTVGPQRFPFLHFPRRAATKRSRSLRERSQPCLGFPSRPFPCCGSQDGTGCPAPWCPVPWVAPTAAWRSHGAGPAHRAPRLGWHRQVLALLQLRVQPNQAPRLPGPIKWGKNRHFGAWPIARVRRFVPRVRKARGKGLRLSAAPAGVQKTRELS